MLRQYELVERVKAYDPDADEDLLNRAYVFSVKAHGSQLRASGDAYFSHPIEVAGILTDLKLDDETIATAILHDTIEDTVATQAEIDRLFGPNVGRLVDGVTKLSKIETQTESERQAENLRKFLLAMSNDIRVLLVKLADRLHNMRTLHHIKSEEKRRRIAKETMDIYVPLAERIGMYVFLDELRELAFRVLEPEAHEMITSRLARMRETGAVAVHRMAGTLETVLIAKGVKAQVRGREKQPYSIWRKMQAKGGSFETLSDVMAFRVIVPDEMACYQALGAVHSRWQMVPGRFKDFISTPKGNGYRSLHTTIMYGENTRIEVQIRTERMHEEAENGVAAHWAYKQGAAGAPAREAYPWLEDLLEVLRDAASPEELLENARMAMFQDQVFAFTPKGALY
ncbi:MAG: HD domain-containing protein, partial [Sphingomonadales bacterium]